MRPVLEADLWLAARAARLVPHAERAGSVRLWIAQADAADRYRKRMGRAHPQWGNGSLAARLAREPLGEERARDPAFLGALAEVARVLAQRAGGDALPLSRRDPM